MTFRNKFGDAATQIGAVRDLRRKLWGPLPVGEESQPKNEAGLLRKMLRGWIRNDHSGSVVIDDKMNGFPVCKSFFRLATGFTKILFNSIVSGVLDPDSRPREYCRPARKGVLDYVSFFHVYFKQLGRSGALLIYVLSFIL